MNIKEYFRQDSIAVGMIAVVLAEIVAAGLLLAVMLIAGIAVGEHQRWFIGVALPALLVVRAYAKYREALSSTKGAICALAATFILLMFFFFKTNTL